ncbi:hypothetical protein [Chryseobacterium oranimense]|uniref:hypothetical protein n=1 Tax=Chryseobacterium oranimense TaxID=421058 RepID=UPI002236A78D|nr:hypothetical protein [Chryseobacterium oranimense]
MKNPVFMFGLLFLMILGLAFSNYSFFPYKDPVVIEVIMKQKNKEDALESVKNVLLKKKFISANGVQKNSLNAVRTTMSKADYFVADATAVEAGGAVKVTVTFVKVGTGFLNLKKLAEEVKKELES